MTDSVEKTGLRSTDTTRHARTVQPQSTAPAAPKASPATDQAPGVPQESVTSYSAMLAEAYDGDHSEALGAGLSGRRPSIGKDSDHRLDDDTDRSGLKRPHVKPQQETSGNSGFLENIRKRQNAGSVESATRNAPTAVPPISTRESHNQLMLAASQLDQSETASYINFPAFNTLTDILSKKTWTRVANIEKNLAARQIENAIQGVRTA